MTELNPSSDWTEAERLEVIKAKTEELGNALQSDTRNKPHLIGHRILMLVTQQLHLLTCAPAEALEMNRDDLLIPVLYHKP